MFKEKETEILFNEIEPRLSEVLKRVRENPKATMVVGAQLLVMFQQTFPREEAEEAKRLDEQRRRECRLIPFGL